MVLEGAGACTEEGACWSFRPHRHFHQLACALTNTARRVAQEVEAAVCLSGQVRTLKRTIDSLRRDVLARFESLHVLAVVPTAAVRSRRPPRTSGSRMGNAHCAPAVVLSGV